MREPLPNAWIGILSAAVDFFDQVAIVAVEGGVLVPNMRHQEVGGLDILELRPLVEASHKGLYGQLIHRADYGARIWVKVRAEKWNCEGSPTYEIYVEALRSIFAILLRSYNKKHGKRYRLSIESKEACEPKLSPEAGQMFEQFVACANMNILHPHDWRRFYQFARMCHVLHVRTTEEEVFRLLVHAGFSESYARELAGIYGHLRKFQRH